MACVDDARPLAAVEVRPEEVARLLRDCLTASVPEADKPTPPLSRITSMLSSAEPRGWGTALQVSADLTVDASYTKEQRVIVAQFLARGVVSIITNINKKDPSVVIPLLGYADRAVTVMQSLLSSAPGPTCLRLACTALRHAEEISVLPGCAEHLRQRIKDLVAAISSAYGTALQSGNVELQRACVDVVECATSVSTLVVLVRLLKGVLICSDTLRGALWRNVVQPFSDEAVGRDHPRVLLAVVESLLNKVEAAVPQATLEGITNGKKEKLLGFYFTQLSKAAENQVSNINPELYLMTMLRFTNALFSMPEHRERCRNVIKSMLRVWKPVSASVISAYASVFHSPAALDNIPSALFVLDVVSTELADAATTTLFVQALEVALELVSRAAAALLTLDNLPNLQQLLCGLMLQASRELPTETQLHIVRALMHPIALASHFGALLFRVLHASYAPTHRTALVRLLCGVAQHSFSLRLCRFACDLDADVAYSCFVMETLATKAATSTPHLADAQWMLAACSLSACRSLPASPARTRHLTTTISVLCPQLLAKMLSSADLSNNGFLALFHAYSTPGADGVSLPQAGAGRPVTLLLQLLDRPDLRASPYFPVAARRTIVLLSTLLRDINNSQGLALLSSLAALVAVPVLFSVIRSAVGTLLGCMDLPRQPVDGPMLGRYKAQYVALFHAIGAQSNSLPLLLSVLASYAAWASYTPFNQLEHFLPEHLADLLPEFLQPSTHRATQELIAEAVSARAAQQSASNVQGDEDAWTVHVSALKKAVAALQEAPPHARARTPLASIIAQLSALEYKQ